MHDGSFLRWWINGFLERARKRFRNIDQDMKSFCGIYAFKLKFYQHVLPMFDVYFQTIILNITLYLLIWTNKDIIQTIKPSVGTKSGWLQVLLSVVNFKRSLLPTKFYNHARMFKYWRKVPLAIYCTERTKRIDSKLKWQTD